MNGLSKFIKNKFTKYFVIKKYIYLDKAEIIQINKINIYNLIFLIILISFILF